MFDVAWTAFARHQVFAWGLTPIDPWIAERSSQVLPRLRISAMVRESFGLYQELIGDDWEILISCLFGDSSDYEQQAQARGDMPITE